MPIPYRERPGFERRAGNSVAFLTSLVFHTTLLLILACWAYSVGKPSRGLLLSAEMGESTETAIDMLPTFELRPQTEELEQEFAEPELLMDVTLEHAIERPANGLNGINATLTAVNAGEVANNLQSKVKVSGRGANFFGAYAEGNRFVYVLDSSRSMTGDRWTYACNQLIDSLNGLKPGQEFFIICFDMETNFLFNTNPQTAKFFEVDKEVVIRVKRWLRSRILGRATMPAEALRFAIEFNPDAIFLLSDGELQDNSLMMLRMINGFSSERRQIPIHTVHLFSMQGRMTLEQIAFDNRGTFTPIEPQSGFGSFRRR